MMGISAYPAHQHLRVGVLLEERFRRFPDGTLFSPSGFGDEFWGRYAQVFGQVTIVARVKEVEDGEIEGVMISDPRVHVLALPSYIGPIGLLHAFGPFMVQLQRALRQLDAVIVRLPGALALLADPFIWRQRKPLAVELVGDPQDVFTRELCGHAAPLLRALFVRSTSSMVRRADAASYVTQRTLQERYPAAPGAIVGAFSSISLPRELLSASARSQNDFFSDGCCRIFAAGSLEVPYKGFDILISATKCVIEKGHDVRLRIAGTGRYEGELRALAARLGIADVVTFRGRLTRQDVLAEMSLCDLYLQPSRTEGLPKAIVEAFACGAPVIASRVGGIPELVPDKYLVEPGNIEQLAERINQLLVERHMLPEMSRRNRAVAEDYISDRLEARRLQFYADFQELVMQKHAKSGKR